MGSVRRASSRGRWLLAVAAVGCAVGLACSRASDAPDADAGPIGFGPSPPDPLEPSDASLPRRVSSMFGTTCRGGPEAACHGTGAGGLALVLGDGGDLVGVPSRQAPSVPRVKPGDPAGSYLYRKVLEDGGVDGARMPPETTYDPRIPALVAAWIEAGAAAP